MQFSLFQRDQCKKKEKKIFQTFLCKETAVILSDDLKLCYLYHQLNNDWDDKMDWMSEHYAIFAFWYFMDAFKTLYNWKRYSLNLCFLMYQ